MTANELADRLEKWQASCRDDMADWQAMLAELRRIPDLERRALTDDDVKTIQIIRDAIDSGRCFIPGGVNQQTLTEILDRIAPPAPLLDWQDHGNGVFTARHDGATYLVRPEAGRDRCVAMQFRDRPVVWDYKPTVEAAKATAEKWARGE